MRKQLLLFKCYGGKSVFIANGELSFCALLSTASLSPSHRDGPLLTVNERAEAQGYMTPRKSHLVRRPRTIWDQKGAPSPAKDPKITRKIAHIVEKTALKPVATGPISEAIGFDADNLPKLPTYKPPLDLEFEKTRAKEANISLKKKLTKALLYTPYPAMKHGNCNAMPPANQRARNHQWEEFPKRRYCIWCKERMEKWKPKRTRPG